MVVLLLAGRCNEAEFCSLLLRWPFRWYHVFCQSQIFHCLAKHHSQGFKRFCSLKESLTKQKEAKREQSVHLWLWGTEMEWQVSIIVNIQKTIIHV